MPLHAEFDELLELRHGARAIGLAAHHRVNSLLAGLYTSVFRGQGMDYEETREYQQGDDIRNMDWRVTARTGVAHLKVFREERERPVILCIDCGPHMQFGTRGTFKSVQAARAAALLGWCASGNHDRVGAVLHGMPYRPMQVFSPSRARQSLWRMLRALTRPAEVGRADGDSLLQALDKLTRLAPSGGLIFVVGDLNREPAGIQHALGRLHQRHEVVLLPVDDPADREMPDIGRAVFQTADGQRVEVDTGSEEGRRAYREAWERNRTELTLMASRFGMPLIPVPTDRDVHQSLVAGLRQRARQRGLR